MTDVRPPASCHCIGSWEEGSKQSALTSQYKPSTAHQWHGNMRPPPRRSPGGGETLYRVAHGCQGLKPKLWRPRELLQKISEPGSAWRKRSHPSLEWNIWTWTWDSNSDHMGLKNTSFAEVSGLCKPSLLTLRRGCSRQWLNHGDWELTAIFNLIYKNKIAGWFLHMTVGIQIHTATKRWLSPSDSQGLIPSRFSAYERKWNKYSNTPNRMWCGPQEGYQYSKEDCHTFLYDCIGKELYTQDLLSSFSGPSRFCKKIIFNLKVYSQPNDQSRDSRLKTLWDTQYLTCYTSHTPFV